MLGLKYTMLKYIVVYDELQLLHIPTHGDSLRLYQPMPCKGNWVVQSAEGSLNL